MILKASKIRLALVAIAACFTTSSIAVAAPRSVAVTCQEQGVQTPTRAKFQFQISEKPSLTGHFPGSVSSFTTKISRGNQQLLDLATVQGEHGRADVFISDDIEIGMNTDVGSIVLVSFNQNLPADKSQANFHGFLRGKITGNRDQIPMTCTLSFR